MLTTKNDFKLTRFAFKVRQKFEAVPPEWESFLSPSDTHSRYNKYLTNLVFSVRTVSYGSSFFPLRFMTRALRAWTINRGEKNSVRYLRYGPRTRLVRGIYSCLYCSFFIVFGLQTGYHRAAKKNSALVFALAWSLLNALFWLQNLVETSRSIKFGYQTVRVVRSG